MYIVTFHRIALYSPNNGVSMKIFLHMGNMKWKLFQNLPLFMPLPHAKFYQNWCTSYGDKR